MKIIASCALLNLLPENVIASNLAYSGDGVDLKMGNVRLDPAFVEFSP
jgi:hypothetical protein